MRRVRFRDPAGSIRTGEWTDEGITFADRTYDEADVDVLPPTEPSKVVCLARNYTEHAGGDTPDRPEFFLKGPNALAGHGDTVTLPDNDPIEFEGEAGVVIGEQCRNVDEADALSVVAGLTCVNDLSNRPDQRSEIIWVRGKAFDNAAPMGPVVASLDEIDDPEEPRVRTWIDGDLRQDTREDEMVFGVSEAIAALTEFVTLEPGDVLAMGTPRGEGPLTGGETVEIEVDGVGRLVHDVERP